MTRLLLLAALLLPLLAACDRAGKAPEFALTNITGASFGKELNLPDHNGKMRSLADFKGKVVVVFFGFTHCPDACPTTLAELSQVMRELGADADKVQVLFVTVDPERDTPAVVGQYASSFHPSFLGLSGDLEATTRVAKEFKVFFQKQPSKSGGYSVDHSAGTYFYDRQGRLRLFAPFGKGGEPILHDVRLLLAGA